MSGIMEAYSLQFERDFEPTTEATTTTTMVNIWQGRKLDKSGSNSTIPGEESTFLLVVYGTVGPAIVTFGLIGNLIILAVVGRSSMSGKRVLIPSVMMSYPST